jgi:hypothetical protein
MLLRRPLANLARSRPARSIAAALGAAALASCSTGPAPSTGSVEYHAQVRPLLEASCTSCHHEGGPAPFSMEYDAAEWESGAPAWAASAVAAAEDGRMPPWLPSGDCRELAYERALTADEKAMLATWRDEGFPSGDPATFPGPLPGDTPPPLGAPAIETAPEEAYVASTAEADDYRCFLLPVEFAEETYLRAADVVPGETALVHHALLYLIPPGSVAGAEARDADDPGPGYTCFGGPGGGALTTLGAWVPGSVVQGSPPGSASIVPAGSRVVMQIHYNTLSLGGAAPPPERSTARFWTTKEKPQYRVEALPMAHLGMNIPAGEEASLQERVFEMPGDGTIIALAPHMHLLGEKISASIEPVAGDPACLIDIPRWDFHWQQNYGLPEPTRVEAKQGDKIRVQCTYDNSAANQPVVDGTKQPPMDVTWGEGTLDEMCLLYVGVMVPYDAPDFRCGAYPACVEKCADGDGACFFDCATVGGGQCGPCLIQAVGKCAPAYCASEGLALQGCTKACPEDGPGCIMYTCAAELDTFYACMEPHLENGDCAEPLAACGL